MKISFLTLGCKLNYAETSTYERGFREAGAEVVPWRDAADICVINTCSVTATADAKSRNLIRKMHKQNPSALIIVTGCSAQLRRDTIEAMEGVARVFGCNEKSLVVPETMSLVEKGLETKEIANKRPETAIFAAYSTGERTRSFLKVQDGCDNFCKYCTVPFARGRSRNISIEECVANARKIAAAGVKEIVLTGVNTGDFGRSTGETFADLIKALNEVEGIDRYRISSIEPNLLTDEIIDWTASGTKFQPHFHIPLQTGSDNLLKAMGRRYDTALFKSRIEMARNAFEGPGKPKVFFGIDLMAGLPGETEDEFLRSLDFIESVNPAFIHVFPYSRRPGTPAADMPGQVAEETKAERVSVLENLCCKLHSEFLENNRGVHEKVLFESANRSGYMEGFSGNYIKVRRPYNSSLVNTIVDVIL